MNSAMTERIATEWVKRNAFSSGCVGRLGVELEWLVIRDDSPDVRVGVPEVKASLGVEDRPLPAGGWVSFEPGGQLELSTAPAESLVECLEAAACDLAVLKRRATHSGLTLKGKGLDDRPPTRIVDISRYAALERNYDQFGPDGRIMMCNTASVQVNVDAGDTSSGWRGWKRRWWMANSLGPILTAMFANSPADLDVPVRSGRQVLRFRTDPTRTDPMSLSGDPREVWASYVLDAQVVGIMQPGFAVLRYPSDGLTMRKWLRGAGPRRVFLNDLHCHLKSVIPPVRPRGHLELRMIDAQDGDNWVVPVVVVSALLDDPLASEEAVRIAESMPRVTMREDWVTAARDAMGDHRIAEAAHHCMEVVLEAMDRLAVPPWVRPIVQEFAETYTFRSRCPADDYITRPAVPYILERKVPLTPAGPTPLKNRQISACGRLPLSNGGHFHGCEAGER